MRTEAINRCGFVREPGAVERDEQGATVGRQADFFRTTRQVGGERLDLALLGTGKVVAEIREKVLASHVLQAQSCEMNATKKIFSIFEVRFKNVI